MSHQESYSSIDRSIDRSNFSSLWTTSGVLVQEDYSPPSPFAYSVVPRIGFDSPIDIDWLGGDVGTIYNDEEFFE